MRLPAYLFCVLIPLSGAKIYEKCELAAELKTKYQMSLEEVKNWVCIAEFESTFNTEAINPTNWDGSKDFGLFQINNRYWCGDDFGKSECGVTCEQFLDDDIEDDLKCAKKIVKDTERWTKKPNGLVAWVAYVRRCQTQDLDAYIKECPGVLETPPKEENQETSEVVTSEPEVKPTKPPRGSGLGFLTGPVYQGSLEPSPNSSPPVTLQMQHLYQLGNQENQIGSLVKNDLNATPHGNFSSATPNFVNILGESKQIFTVLFIANLPKFNLLESLRGQRPDSIKPLTQYTLRPLHDLLLSTGPSQVTHPDLKHQIIPLSFPTPGSTRSPLIPPVTFPYFQHQPVPIPPYPHQPISHQPLRMEHLLPGDSRFTLSPFGINHQIPNAILYPFLVPSFGDVDTLPHKPVSGHLSFLTP